MSSRRAAVPDVPSLDEALPWLDRRPTPRVRIAPNVPLSPIDGIDWPGDVALFELDEPGALQAWL